jgi:hypothetical protein
MDRNSLASMLVVVLIVLKMTHLIEISWWWVFCPWWIPIVAALSIMFTTAVVLFLIDNKR